VRYVLEGSIRRGGGRVRITAQLIDASTGTHRWADRYDRTVEDVFAVQDEVARTIVAILAAHVNKAEAERTLLKRPANLLAYDYYLQAGLHVLSFLSSFKVQELYATRRLLEHALKMDPAYARAFALLPNTHILAWSQAVDDDYLKPTALEQAFQLASRAVRLDANLPQAYANFANALSWKHEHDAAVAAWEKVLVLNPNFSDWRFASALVYAGAARAIDVCQKHMRLDPFYPPLAPGWLGMAHYMLRKYPEAVKFLEECLSRVPNFRPGHVWLAATHAQLGDIDKARVAVANVLRLQTDFTIEGTAAKLNHFKLPDDAEHYFAGLLKAGLPLK
jgi:adenylate cyclase